MRGRSPLLVLVLAAGGCTTLGTAEVRVETGNQSTGTLIRPLLFTASSDDSIQRVAQDICDNVKRGSTAAITFLGKVPSPEPISLADWGRYRYECVGATAPARPATPAAAPRAAAPTALSAPAASATAAKSAAPAASVASNPSAAPESPAALAAPPAPMALAPGAPSATTPSTGAAAPPAAAATLATDTSERHGRDCLLQQGRYHVCLGNCLLNASGVGASIAAACEAGCAPGLPASCR